MALFDDLNREWLPNDLDGIFLVGGTVRDLIAGRRPTDIDLVVQGDIALAAGQIASKTGGRIVNLGQKGFDCLRVVAPRATIDVTPLRHPTIEADLLQRDFTINAMAYEVASRRLVDCSGGLRDLRGGTVRMVSAAAFENDPVRLVRAYRLSATLAFCLSTQTQAAIGRHQHRIADAAPERVWSELLKIFAVENSAPALGSMASCGLLTAIFPELKACMGCTQNRHHQWDVFDHSLKSYAHLEGLLCAEDGPFAEAALLGGSAERPERAAILKYSALLHDVGKPQARQVGPDGAAHFPGHASRSARISDAISRRLRLSNRQRETANAVIRHHIRPLSLFLAAQNQTLGPKGTIRFFNRCGRLTAPIILHAVADCMAKGDRPQYRNSALIAFYRQLLTDYNEYCMRQRRLPPLISGHDLIRVFGLSPAPDFKIILKRVAEGRLCGELTTRGDALRWVAAYLGRTPPHAGA